MSLRWLFLVLVALILAGSPAPGQLAMPSTTTATLAERAARRFPQPVRVGDLIGRQVLQPTPAQHVLGRVAGIDRKGGGGIDVAVRFGGLFGFGGRLIAVPVEAVALLGEHVVVMDFTPEQLRDFPTLPAPATDRSAVGNDETIRVGLTKPFH